MSSLTDATPDCCGARSSRNIPAAVIRRDGRQTGGQAVEHCGGHVQQQAVTGGHMQQVVVGGGRQDMGVRLRSERQTAGEVRLQRGGGVLEPYRLDGPVDHLQPHQMAHRGGIRRAQPPGHPVRLQRGTGTLQAAAGQRGPGGRAGHQEPGRESLGLLLVLRPALTPTPRRLLLVVDAGAVAHPVVAQLVRGRVPHGHFFQARVEQTRRPPGGPVHVQAQQAAQPAPHHLHPGPAQRTEDIDVPVICRFEGLVGLGRRDHCGAVCVVPAHARPFWAGTWACLVFLCLAPGLQVLDELRHLDAVAFTEGPSRAGKAGQCMFSCVGRLLLVQEVGGRQPVQASELLQLHHLHLAQPALDVADRRAHDAGALGDLLLGQPEVLARALSRWPRRARWPASSAGEGAL